MPNNIDFSKVENIKEIIIYPNGWINPLTIEYGTSDNLYVVPSCFWRIKGTQHTFIIPITRIDFLSKGDYGKHFAETLEIFREDYLSWQEKGSDTEWVQQYRQQYKQYIII